MDERGMNYELKIENFPLKLSGVNYVINLVKHQEENFFKMEIRVNEKNGKVYEASQSYEELENSNSMYKIFQNVEVLVVRLIERIKAQDISLIICEEESIMRFIFQESVLNRKMSFSFDLQELNPLNNDSKSFKVNKEIEELKQKVYDLEEVIYEKDSKTKELATKLEKLENKVKMFHDLQESINKQKEENLRYEINEVKNRLEKRIEELEEENLYLKSTSTKLLDVIEVKNDFRLLSESNGENLNQDHVVKKIAKLSSKILEMSKNLEVCMAGIADLKQEKSYLNSQLSNPNPNKFNSSSKEYLSHKVASKKVEVDKSRDSNSVVSESSVVDQIWKDINSKNSKEIKVEKFNLLSEPLEEKINRDAIKVNESVNISNMLDLFWDENFIKEGEYKIFGNSPKRLYIRGSSCFNYIFVNYIFLNESFQIEIESNINQVDLYTYIGIMTGDFDMNNNCCCSTSSKNIVFADASGKIYHEDWKETDDNELQQWNKRDIISIYSSKVSEIVREVYFEVNNKKSKKYLLSGADYRIFVGYCNEARGYFEIRSFKIFN